MKPAPFEYSRPADIDEACALLAADDGARVIAGGQTLVPLMAMRLARPTRLIDIARIPGLAYVRDEGKDIAIGATTRQHVIESDPVVRAKLPLLAKVMPFVGHTATRARGTVGGSLVNGDPAAEIVLVAVTLGATLVWRDGGTDNSIAASDFFLGPMVTALPLTACLAEARFPVWPEPRVGVGFHEINARQSDFAFVSAAAQIALDADGRCTRAAIGIGAATAVPLRLDAVAEALQGQALRRRRGARSRSRPRSPTSKPMADLHASAEYRKRVAVTLAVRAIADAYQDAARRAMKVELDINKRKAHGRGRAAHEPARLPARQALAHRRACRLRAWRLRRLHRAGRWRRRALLPDVRGAGRRLCHHHHRRACRPGRASCRRCRTRSAKPTACSAAIARRR